MLDRMKIDILGRIYTVYTNRQAYPASQDLKDHYDGFHSWSGLCIFVDGALQKVDQISTLIHEITHSVVDFGKDESGWVLQFDDADGMSEYICSSIDDGWAYVMTHNPDLMVFLSGYSVRRPTQTKVDD